MRMEIPASQCLKSHPIRLRRAMLGLMMITLLVVGHAVGQPGEMAQATEVIGDDERDMFVGSGSLLLPPGISETGRNTAATCPGCRWRAVQTCDPSTPTACRGAARLCPHDALWLKIYLARPGEDWQVVGSDCFTAGGPVTRERAELELRQRVEESVPALRPTIRPPGGILVHLPVHVDSGQPPGSHHWEWEIVGLSIQTEAMPAWWWRSGATDLGPTSSPSTSFVYRMSGAESIEIATTWAARYWVSGIGPLSVAGQVRQASSIDITVGEGRAVLVR
jgi:hypothetical protein